MEIDMKKIYATILAAAIAVSQTAVFAADTDAVSAVYDGESRSVKIEGRIGTSEDVPVTVCISGEADAVFSDDNLPAAAYVIFTGSDGNFSDSRSFAGVLPGGVLELTLTSASGTLKTEILVYSEDDENTKTVLAAVNAATDAKTLASYLAENKNIEKLGFRYADTENYLEEVAAFCIARRAQNKADFTLSELSEEIHFALLICEVKGGADINESMAQHYSGVESTYEEFEKLSAEIREEIAAVINDADYLKQAQRPELGTLELVAKARCAAGESWTALRSVLTENAESYGISFSGDWSNISESNKPKVFSEIMNDVKKAVDTEKIGKLFDAAAEKVLKQQKEDNKKGSSSGGGSSSSSSSGSGNTGIISYPEIDKTVFEESGFSDTKGHFSEQAVAYLTEKNIISGYPDKTFRPDSKLSRAEFAAIVCKAFDFTASAGGAKFADVNESDWFYSSVSALADNNVAAGYDGKFSPGDVVTRQDAAVMLKKSLEAKGIAADAEKTDFSDFGDVSEYAKGSVGALCGAGIISGYDGLFRPKDSVTRAEAAVMVYKILTQMF